MTIAETDRLKIRKLELSDAPFILELLNEPGWLEFIGDKGVNDISAAENYLREGPLEMYVRLGFGLFAVEMRRSGLPIGICGPIKRDSLREVDLGFAFLERFWGKGYAYESAVAVLNYSSFELGLSKIVAITVEGNEASRSLLEKLGFECEDLIDRDENLLLYSRQLAE